MLQFNASGFLITHYLNRMWTLKHIFPLLLIFISGITAANTEAAEFSFRGRQPGDTAAINKYTRLAMKQLNQSTLESMKSYIDSAEMVCRKDNIEAPAFLHFARAWYFFYTNDFKHASQESGMAMKIAKDEDNKALILRTMFFYGKYNYKVGFIDESIKYYDEAIALAGRDHLQIYLPALYSGLSDAYKIIGKVKESREALKNVIIWAKKTGNSFYIKSGYYTLGTSYMDTDSYMAIDIDNKKADSLVRKALEYSLNDRDTQRISSSLANLGWNYYLQEQYDSAIIFYNRSLKYSIPTGNFGASANAYGNLGTIYRDMGNSDIALRFYMKALDFAKKVHDIYSLWWINRDMSEMYLARRDTGKAYLTYVNSQTFYEDWTNSQRVQGLEDAKIKYEADVENKEFQLLALRVRNQRLLIFGSSGLFLLSIAVLVLILSRSKINSKRKISEMNHKISDITQANLRQQMNPHFIFNTLNSIQYYMYRHDKLATNEYLTKFSNLMRKVLENSQHTSVPLQDELDALNLYLELEKIRFKEKFDYEISIDEEIDTIMYKVPTMLIQPYVENSICHGLIPAEEKGRIRVDLKLKKNYISCIIEDNGIGREAAMAKKNSNNSNHNSIGTRIVSSRLELVNALYGTNLKTVYTDLKNSNGEAEGTRVEIHIPILT